MIWERVYLYVLMSTTVRVKPGQSFVCFMSWRCWTLGIVVGEGGDYMRERPVVCMWGHRCRDHEHVAKSLQTVFVCFSESWRYWTLHLRTRPMPKVVDLKHPSSSTFYQNRLISYTFQDASTTSCVYRLGRADACGHVPGLSVQSQRDSIRFSCHQRYAILSQVSARLQG